MPALDRLRAGSLKLREYILGHERDDLRREAAYQWSERHPEELIDLLFATPDHDLLRVVGNLRERVTAAVEAADIYHIRIH